MMPDKWASLRRLINRFNGDERGSIAIIGAAAMLLVIGFAALSIDVGTIFADKRRT